MVFKFICISDICFFAVFCFLSFQRYVRMTVGPLAKVMLLLNTLSMYIHSTSKVTWEIILIHVCTFSGDHLPNAELDYSIVSASGDTGSNAVEDALLLLPQPTPEPRSQNILESASVISPPHNGDQPASPTKEGSLSKSASETDLTNITPKTLVPIDTVEQPQVVEGEDMNVRGVTKVTVNIVK